MLRRLINTILDHQAVRLREENRELAERFIECRKIAGENTRDQNEMIRSQREELQRQSGMIRSLRTELHDAHEQGSSSNLCHWKQAALRLARECGANIVGDDHPYPGPVIDAGVQALARRRTVTDLFAEVATKLEVLMRAP